MLSGLILSAALAVPGANPYPQTGTKTPSPPMATTPTVPMPMNSTPMATTPTVPMTETMLPPLPPEEVLFPGQEPTVAGSLQDSHTGHPDRLWGGVNYLMYWYKNGPSPVSLLNRTSAAGVVTRVAGGEEYDYGAASGIGFNAGLWLNDRHTIGFEVNGLLMEKRSVFSAFASDATGSPQLTRPFTDALQAAPSAVIVSSPGTIAGGFATASGIRLAGMEGLGVRNLMYCKNYSLDFLAGGRYLDLDEFLDLTQVSRPIAGGQIFFNGAQLPANQGVTINDRFRTRNQFWGGVVGLRGEYFFGPLFVKGVIKVGMGNNHQTVDIDGSTMNGTVGIPGGLLAVRNPNGLANIGRNSNNRFAVMNELGAQIGIHVTEHARILVGYDFLYLNNVVRAGQQIDPIVNTRLVPTSASFGTAGGIISPVVTGIRDDFYAHGLRFGLELKY